MECNAVWADHTYYKADANKVAAEIKSLGDDVTPQQLVEFAKDENTEVHKCFTWDDTEAARKYRIYEARQVFIRIKIEKVEDSGEKTITPIRVFYKTNEGEGYKPTEIIVKKADEYAALIERVKSELRAIETKYKYIKELTEVWEAIEHI